MWERFKCFSVKILDYYNVIVHSLVCNKLSMLCIHSRENTEKEVTMFKY